MMSHGHRLLVKWARYIHVYVTLLGFGLILFFGVTGFFLNHEEWFGLSEPIRAEKTGTLPMSMLDPVDQLAVVEALRKEYGATGSVATTDFDIQDDSVRVVFRSAGGLCEAKINRADGKMEMTSDSNGVIGVLTDLHRGKSRDKTLSANWSLLIDIVAGLFVVVSITGLILWTSLRSRGKYGLTVIVFGIAASAAVYYLYVP